MMLRRIVAGVVAAGIASLALVGMPTAAYGAPNAGILVGAVTIAPADVQPTIGDTLTVSGRWDASEADPHAGDTFTVGLPPEFVFSQALPFPLVGTDEDGGPLVWGDCLTDPATGVATCELSDAVEATPELAQGTWQFPVDAVGATPSEGVAFDLNGTRTIVDLPGDGGIDDGLGLPAAVSISGMMNENNWSMTWTVSLPGANLVGQDSVTMRDTLGAGHQLCTPTGFAVSMLDEDTVVDVTSLVAEAPAPGATDFEVVLTAPDAGFDADGTYRVTYQTCTPDGRIDRGGTFYDNLAQIEGWGIAGVGFSQVQNLDWQQSVSKSGRVLGGAERNGRIAWTVTIPGEQLLEKSGFTMTETLGPGHEVCADTISGIEVAERYGPSDQLQQDITSRLTVSTLTSDPQSFRVQFDIDDGSFLFSPSDHRYVITYVTCVTDTALPAGGTTYANEVDIDGHDASAEAIVPVPDQGKSGRINASSVTVDGVRHMPQTTLDWTARIPGRVLENIDGSLTLTDTIATSLAVCTAGEPSGGLKSRLNLRVEARDQVQDGGLMPVDLTAATEVTQNGAEIAIEVDPIDLPIPTGTSDGFTREYEYVITYTTCTASGGVDAPGTVYSNRLVGSGVDFAATVTKNDSGPGTGVSGGSVAIDKILADTPGADLVPDTTTFAVHVREIDPNGATQNEYDLTVPLSGAPVTGLTARGTGWTAELTEPTFPAIRGVTFAPPVFAPGPGLTVSPDGTIATASLTPGTNVAVTLVNEAVLETIGPVVDVEAHLAVTGANAATAWIFVAIATLLSVTGAALVTMRRRRDV